MNLLILLLIIGLSIVSPMGGLGILSAIALIYFFMANNVEKENIRKKFMRWSWTDWRV